MIWAAVCSQSCFCWLYRASPSLTAKNIIHLILVFAIWWCPSMCRVLCFWKRMFAMTSAFSWQNCISLCPASFCTPRSNLPVTPVISWLPTFSLQFPVMKKTSFFVVVILGNLLGLYTNVQLQLPWHQWLWHRLGLLWSWMVCLEDEVKSSCHFSQNIKGTFWPFKKNHMKRCQYC